MAKSSPIAYFVSAASFKSAMVQSPCSFRVSYVVRSLFILLAISLLTEPSFAQEIIAKKISATEGNFDGALDAEDDFGFSVASLGDLDGDGVTDIAVGAPGDDDAGSRLGAVWILRLNRDGTVKRHTKVMPPARLVDGLEFGGAVTAAGDVDGNGVVDLMITGDRQLYLVYLDDQWEAMGFELLENGCCPREVAGIGDVDGDGRMDFAEGNNGSGRGSFFILYPFAGGPDLFGAGFGGRDTTFATFVAGDLFGASPSLIDLFGTETSFTIAVGSPGRDSGGPGRGAVWLIELRKSLSIAGNTPLIKADSIASSSQGLRHPIRDGDFFGDSIANLGDLDGDGNPEIAVGAPGDDGDGFNQGSLWIVFLNASGRPKTDRTIGSGDAELQIDLSDSDHFGESVTAIGDLNEDGIVDLAVGAPGNEQEGGVWILYGLPALPAEVLLEDLSQTPKLGEDLLVEAEIAGVSDVASAKLNFRRAGDARFFSSEMTKEGPARYSFPIPAFEVSSRGVEYFVTTTGSGGGQARAPSEGIVSIPVIAPDGLSFDVPSGNSADGYRLVSFPLNLDSTDARSVFEDDLGRYDGSAWRFFSFSRAGRYVELSEQNIEVTPGQSYWLLVRDPNRVVTSGSGISVRTGQPFSLPLNLGWNLIGDPFNFPIPAANLRTSSGQVPDIRSYDGIWSAAGDTLEPFSGYALFSEALDTLWLDPDLTEQPSLSAPIEIGHAAKRGGGGWKILVSATDGRARDTDNVLGVATGSMDAWDHGDRPEPPPIGDYISVYFPHPEWGRVTDRYGTDLRSNSSHGQSWTIAIESPTRRIVDLNLEFLEGSASDIDLSLVDATTGTRQNLRTHPTYRLVSGTPSSPRTIEIVSGTNPSFDVPIVSDVRLDVFPNPFSNVATFAMDLPTEAATSLRIYDALGREVSVLIDQEVLRQGRSVAFWDGRTIAGTEAAAGVYLARLEASGSVTSRTVVLSN